MATQSTIAAYGITMIPEESGDLACPMFHLFLWPPSGAFFGGTYNPENNTTPGDPALPYLEKAKLYASTPEYQDVRKMITSLRPGRCAGRQRNPVGRLPLAARRRRGLVSGGAPRPCPECVTDVDLRGVGDGPVPEEPHGDAEHDGGAHEEDRDHDGCLRQAQGAEAVAEQGGDGGGEREVGEDLHDRVRAGRRRSGLMA